MEKNIKMYDKHIIFEIRYCYKKLFENAKNLEFLKTVNNCNIHLNIHFGKNLAVLGVFLDYKLSKN